MILIAAAAATGWYAGRDTVHEHRLEKRTTPDGAVYYTCPMHPQVHQDAPGQCPICGMKLVSRQDAPSAAGTSMRDARRPLYWYDPMHPEQHFDAPGPSPFMDMELVPRYADADAPAGGSRDVVVSIDPRMAQNLGMRTAAVESGTAGQPLEVVGSVAVDETRIAVVEARAAGWVERLDVRAVGETVRRNQVVAGLYAPELLAAQEELALARKLGDTTLIDAAQARLSLLDAGGKAQRREALRAPQDGVVTELMVRQGARVTPGMPLMKLADLSTVWILVEVPESQAAMIAVGARAQARLRGLPGRSFEGRVEHVYPILDSPTRTLRARLVFDNPDGALKPGMYADVSVLADARGDDDGTLLVPSEAVIRTGTRNVVIVAESAGRYRPVEVGIGGERGDRIVILHGLERGQQVVVSGQFLIDSEASLLGAYRRMSDAAGSTP